MDLFSTLWIFISYGFVAALSILVLLSVVLYMVTDPYPVVARYEEEEKYYDPITKAKLKFPGISEAQSVNLSVVVPAYNEMERLPPMLDEALEFLEDRTKDNSLYKYEIIVVSDGSKDSTVQVATKYVEKYGSEKVRCLELVKNRGKGGAVRLGIQSSRGAAILFADADGASKFEDLTKLEAALKDILNCDVITKPADVSDGLALVIGSRAHLEKESLATRSLFRAFDVELLYIAQQLNIPIAEIPVRWTEIEGSKVTPVLSWIQMGCDLGLIWLKYTIGAWKIKSDKKE